MDSPRRDTINADPRLRKLPTHHPTQMRRRRLGRIIRKMRLRMPHHATHTANHDHARRVALLEPLLQQRQERHRAEEHRGHVRVVRLVPGVGRLRGPVVRGEFVGVGGFRVAFGTWDARGGDEEREVGFAGGEVLGEVGEVVFGGHVAGA
jgi:hypothetical protein